MPKRGEIFGSIPVGKIGRTNFNLSHQLTGNFAEGLCYPVFCEDALPGDSWRINAYNISKLETLISPAMQRTDASLLWFKIPKRLLMRQFKKWYTGGTDGRADIEKPFLRLSTIVDYFQNLAEENSLSQSEIDRLTDFFFGPGSLWQMIGLPIPYDYSGTTPKIVSPVVEDGANYDPNWSDEIQAQKIDLLPFIAYAVLYDEYFRDQTLSEPMFTDDISEYPALNTSRVYEYHVNADLTLYLHSNYDNLFDGGEFGFGEILSLFILFRRAWQKDYYTSALPTPQRGPEVSLDVFTDQSAPVYLDQGQEVIISGSSENSGLNFRFSGDAALSQATLQSEVSSGNTTYLSEDQDTRRITGINGFLSKSDGGFTPDEQGLRGSVDLSGLSPITIAAFRNLFKLQAFLEKNNVAGGRFIEFILAHWAERVPDFTVQRPVFVRATKIPITVSEVTSTASTGSDDMNNLVGDQAGRAKGQGNLGKVSIYTQEPSIIIGIYCVTIPPAYIGQGIPKKFQRFTRWDEPYAEFQHIGEQAILNKELFVPWSESGDLEKEFGYQQRYSEFKYLPDRVVGDFATSLAYWNQARIFSGAPALNQTFIEQSPSERIFAVQNQKPVIADFWFQITCKRKLSKFSTPKLN